MNQKICDFCGEIIRKKLYCLTVTEIPLRSEEDKLANFLTIEEMFQIARQRQNDLVLKSRYFEVDESCKKILDYLLTLRKDQLTELKNQVEGIFKLPLVKDEGEV